MSEPSRTLSSFEDLVLHEAEILRAVQLSAQTTELFVVSPLRFLREQGFAIEGELATRLIRPDQDDSPCLYDEIARGERALFAEVGAAVTVNVVSAGLHKLFAKG